MSFFPVESICISGREAFFCAKLLRPGTTSSAASLSACVYNREPPQIFSCLQKFGYPGLAAGSTLALCSLMAAVVDLHEKRPALPKKLKELHKREKNWNSKHKEL